MSVQLRSSVPIYGSRTIVLEAGCHPLAGCFRGMIAADARLNEFLQLIERYLHAVPMCLADLVVSANKSGQRNTLRRAESSIPRCTVFHRAHRLAASINVFTRGLVAD